MILIYTPKITSRAKYAFNLIFRDVYGVKFELTADKDFFLKQEGPRLTYSHQPFGDELFIQSKGLLFETGISDQDIAVFNWKDTKAFFSVGPKSALPFDIFSAAFFLASRYEEYLPHIRDVYDRFDAQASLAYSYNFLHQPVVNKWAQHFKEVLSQKYPELVFQEKVYRFISSIDIDNAYAYQEKGFVRSVGGFLKSLSMLDMKTFKERLRVLTGAEKDPYDTYDFQLDLQKKYNLEYLYFFLLGDYGVNDKSISVESRKFRSLIKSLADYAQVGIHPSFGSNDKPGQLSKEVSRLSGVINREVFKSRQHFLKMSLPDTYRNLIELDILEDYTMGYASDYGFRAGLCTPFFFYDLDLEIETSLKIYPFAIMEGTLKYYQKIPPEKAMEHYKPIIDQVKAVNGIFISLWHNDSMNDRGLWRGWRKVYVDMVEYAKPDGN
ncbi:MAG: polysaccharide deacetylase family protein [Flavobacteriales bacterium]